MLDAERERQRKVVGYTDRLTQLLANPRTQLHKHETALKSTSWHSHYAEGRALSLLKTVQGPQHTRPRHQLPASKFSAFSHFINLPGKVVLETTILG